MQSEPSVRGRVRSPPPLPLPAAAPAEEGAGPPLLKTDAAAAVAALPPAAAAGIAPPSSTSPRHTGRATDARAACETACACRGAKTRRDARAARAAGAAPPAPRGSRRRQRRWSARGVDTGRERPAAAPDAAPAGSGASGARSSAASCAAWTAELNGTGGATEHWKRGGSASGLGSHRRAQSSANTAADVDGSSSASSPHVSRSDGRLRSWGAEERGKRCSQSGMERTHHTNLRDWHIVAAQPH